ncbi:HypC/HybG/HupF family hydrogenase formation chaperone [Haliea sp.]|uniref:HypC/HybG/HupF family hydrogenase formation chaperone n=1 Tax=Haliea sp. TaxID=1932666 RepID=UPI00352777C4
MCLAIPGRVISISGVGLERQALVRFGDVERVVNLCLTPEVVTDDYVIVHVGCAIRVLDQEEAQRALSLLHELASMERGHAVS